MEEGELFGVRAIQSGFYGGVAQSAPSSPVGSRAPSLYNQPTSPSGPLNDSSPYIPLMHPQAARSTTSLQTARSPLGLNPMRGEGPPQLYNGPPSPIPNALIRDSQRPGTAGSNRGFERPPFSVRQDSAHSSRTINLDGFAPPRQQDPRQQDPRQQNPRQQDPRQQDPRQQEPNVPLRPSASDASTDSPSSTNKGTSHGSRSSSFTSTYSFEEGLEQQPRNPRIVKPFEGLPTLPVLQPLMAEVHNTNSRKPTSPPMQRNTTATPPAQGSSMTAELPCDLQRSPPRETNFSTPFRRTSQPEHMNAPPSPGFGPLPAAAMNGGPQQFDYFSRNQSPGPHQARGPNEMDRSMSPGPRNQIPPRHHPLPRAPNSAGPFQESNGGGHRRDAPTPSHIAPGKSKQPSLPAFLQADDGFQSTNLDMPQHPGSKSNFSNEPRSAPPAKSKSSHLLPEPQRKNRLTAEILGDFYDSYSYTREEQENDPRQQQLQQQQNQYHRSQYQPEARHQSPNQQFEMHRIPGASASLPGSPRRLQAPMDRRMI